LGTIIELLSTHGYLAFFVWILANRIGAPLPATPVLLAAGALSGLGEVKFPTIVLLAVLATLLSDVVWFEIGRRHGTRLLRLICRLALQPASVSHRAQELISRHGARLLLIAKFIPGMNRASLPLTGSSRVSYPSFLAYDLVGSTLWVCGYLGLGYAFCQELHRALGMAPTFGVIAAGIALTVAALYIAVRYTRRQRAVAAVVRPSLPQK
jgi:membrane protein DedA with SNARE-associated domain